MSRHFGWCAGVIVEASWLWFTWSYSGLEMSLDQKCQCLWSGSSTQDNGHNGDILDVSLCEEIRARSGTQNRKESFFQFNNDVVAHVTADQKSEFILWNTHEWYGLRILTKQSINKKQTFLIEKLNVRDVISVSLCLWMPETRFWIFCWGMVWHSSKLLASPQGSWNDLAYLKSRL